MQPRRPRVFPSPRSDDASIWPHVALDGHVGDRIARSGGKICHPAFSDFCNKICPKASVHIHGKLLLQRDDDVHRSLAGRTRTDVRRRAPVIPQSPATISEAGSRSRALDMDWLWIYGVVLRCLHTILNG